MSPLGFRFWGLLFTVTSKLAGSTPNIVQNCSSDLDSPWRIRQLLPLSLGFRLKLRNPPKTSFEALYSKPLETLKVLRTQVYISLKVCLLYPFTLL